MAKMIDVRVRVDTQEVKYINVTLDLDWNGQETLNGAIRVCDLYKLNLTWFLQVIVSPKAWASGTS